MSDNYEMIIGDLNDEYTILEDKHKALEEEQCEDQEKIDNMEAEIRRLTKLDNLHTRRYEISNNIEELLKERINRQDRYINDINKRMDKVLDIK